MKLSDITAAELRAENERFVEVMSRLDHNGSRPGHDKVVYKEGWRDDYLNFIKDLFGEDDND